MALCVVHLSVCLCVCISVDLVLSAKTVGRNEIPFGRNTRVTPNNIVLDGALVPPRELEIWSVETVNIFTGIC